MSCNNVTDSQNQRDPVGKDLADVTKQIESLSSMSSEDREKLSATLAHIFKIEETFTSFHRGPIPSPEAIAQYKQHYPDAPKIIFEMANRESTTRESFVKGTNFNERLVIIGSIMSQCLVLGLSGFAIYQGRLWVGVTLGLTGFAGFVIREISKWKHNKAPANDTDGTDT